MLVSFVLVVLVLILVLVQVVLILIVLILVLVLVLVLVPLPLSQYRCSRCRWNFRTRSAPVRQDRHDRRTSNGCC